MGLSTLVVRQAMLPQQGIDALLLSLQRVRQREQAQPDGDGLHLLPRRTVLEELSWIDSKGQAIVITAEARLDSVRPAASSSMPSDPLAGITLDARPTAPAAVSSAAVPPAPRAPAAP